ncbi:MAG: ArsR/SmtB family transcription factor [Alphaproteobacteria bacterium]
MTPAVQETAGLQGAFRALADPTRRQILMHLSVQEMTIGDVVDRFHMTRGAIKKHLTILEEGQLISVRTQGRERINRLEPLGLRSAADWMNFFNRFWDERFDALQKAIENEKGDK